MAQATFAMPWPGSLHSGTARLFLSASTRTTELPGDECEFVLSYCDYALTCREVGVEPLALDALRQLIATLTETART
jgi:hypothetical protein